MDVKVNFKMLYAAEQLSLWAMTTEAHVPRTCVLQQEKPHKWEAWKWN